MTQAPNRSSTLYTGDRALALTWLVRARRGVLALQLLLMAAAEAGTDMHVHSPALLAVLSALFVIDLAEHLYLRRRAAPDWLVPAHAAVDLVALTAILLLSGGPHNPLMSAYLVYVALLALTLPARAAWGASIATMAMQGFAVLDSGRLPGLDPRPLPLGHLLGHLAAFDLATLAITWVVNRLSLALHEREAAELRAQRRQAITERLAALGTLAAGVAHELGTPLGIIQLLAEEEGADPDPDPERMDALIEQVDRCRSMLDRLRGRDSHGPEECVPDVAGWVAEWQRTEPDVAIDLRLDASGPVAGTEESWRGALWVALDNARRAGARHVSVLTREEEAAVALEVQDDGAGLDEQAAAHTGEPFRSTWGGTGLGLFVARTFAQSVGGDVELQPGPEGGALATIRMPRVTA